MNDDRWYYICAIVGIICFTVYSIHNERIEAQVKIAQAKNYSK